MLSPIHLHKFLSFDGGGIDFSLEAFMADLEEDILHLCHMKNITIFTLTHIASESLWSFLDNTTSVLLGREVNKSPALQKPMNSDNAAHITWEVAPTLSRGEEFFYILAPHPNDAVPQKAVHLSIFAGKIEMLWGERIKEFGEELLLYRVDGVDIEPLSKSR